jgi:D-alanine-D-alanine ligase
MRVALLLPPRTADERPDQEDTFVQAAEVAACLRGLGHEPVEVAYLDHGAGTAAAIAGASPEVVLNPVEEVPEGLDHLHLVTDLLERIGVRYTGARSRALADLGDKRAMKARLAAAGLPVAAGIDGAAPGTRFIVKSAREHASLGLDDHSVVTGAEAARALMARKAADFGGDWFAEAFIEGREFDLSMVEQPRQPEPLVFPPAEIVFADHADRPRIYSYASKWEEGSLAYEATPRIFPAREEPLFSKLERFAVAAWHEFGLTGCCHVEFRVDAAGNPCILEVNANPCLTREAGYIASAEQAGLTQPDIVAALLAAA